MQIGEELGGGLGRENEADLAGEVRVKLCEGGVMGGGVGEGEGHDFGFAVEESAGVRCPLLVTARLTGFRGDDEEESLDTTGRKGLDE